MFGDKIEDHWISLKSEQKPLYSGRFLVSIQNSSKTITSYYDREIDMWAEENVIAWMEIPEPYNDISN